MLSIKLQMIQERPSRMMELKVNVTYNTDTMFVNTLKLAKKKD